LALGADAIELQFVTYYFEIVVGRNALLQFLYGRIAKFRDFTTGGTYEMIMVVVVIAMLVAGLVISKLPFLS